MFLCVCVCVLLALACIPIPKYRQEQVYFWYVQQNVTHAFGVANLQIKINVRPIRLKETQKLFCIFHPKLNS